MDQSFKASQPSKLKFFFQEILTFRIVILPFQCLWFLKHHPKKNQLPHDRSVKEKWMIKHLWAEEVAARTRPQKYSHFHLHSVIWSRQLRKFKRQVGQFLPAYRPSTEVTRGQCILIPFDWFYWVSGCSKVNFLKAKTWVENSINRIFNRKIPNHLGLPVVNHINN